MTELEQQIAIAEACGYVDVKLTPHPFASLRHSASMEVDKILTGVIPNKSYRYPIPNYPHDLDAMSKAEKKLCKENEVTALQLGYAITLHNIVHPEPTISYAYDFWCLARATAAQRAEAFLKTVGKWKEPKAKGNL